MKKIIYVSFLNEDIRPGYKSKIHSQCRAFSNLDIETFLYIINNEGALLYKINKNSEKIIQEFRSRRKRFFNKRNIVDELFLFNKFINDLLKIVNDIKPQIVYIRRILPITLKLIKALKLLKNEGIKVLYEYPTYPWEKEMLVSGQYLFYIIDKILYRFLTNSVTKLVVVGTKGQFNSKYVEIANAISVENITLRKPVIKNGKTINLLGVAHVSYFHGYDRLIEGMKIFYESNEDYNIVFNIVGPVNKKLKLEKLVEKYDLNDNVKFLGYRTGYELDKHFDEADIGIGCLGVHRKGIHFLNSLKNREYVARGIPFIFSECDEVIEKEHPNFIFKVPEDETPINIKDIISFYYSDKDSEQEMQKFAQQKLSWESQMIKVLSSIE